MNKSEFNYINDIESWLYNYRSIQAAIVNLQLEYDNIKDDVLFGSVPDETPCRTNKFNSMVENSLSRKEMLEQRIEHMKIKMAQIDKALEVLTESEYKVIENFYIKGMRYYEFTYEMGFGERSCKRLKNKALNKLVIAIYGI